MFRALHGGQTLESLKTTRGAGGVEKNAALKKQIQSNY